MKQLLVSLALFAGAATSVSAAPSPTSISVTGSATVARVPDQATVNATVVTTADRASDAVADNNRRYDAIVAAVMRAGIRRDDVTLSYYNVNYVPKPDPMPASPSPYDRYGYTVTRSFAIKVRQMDRAGSVVDAATAAGATNIEGVAFGLANPAAARSEATREAVADARAKATELAKAAGLHVTGIKSIELGGAPTVRPLMMAKAAMPAGAGAPTEFDSGNVTVTADVTVVFSAEP